MIVISNIIEGIKAVLLLYFLTRKDGICKSVKVRTYIPLLNPSAKPSLLEPTKTFLFVMLIVVS